MQSGNKLPYMGLILLQSLIYGIGNPITKIAYESITPLWCVAIRFVLAFLCFILLVGGKSLPVLRKTPLKAYLPASVCIALCYICCNCAIKYTNTTTAGFLMSMGMLFVPFWAKIIMRRKYRLIHIPIQIAALLGLYFLCADGSSISFGIGEVLAILSSLFGAASLVFSEKSLQNLDAYAITTAQLGVTAVISLVFALLLDDIYAVTAVKPVAWGVIFYLALACSIGGYSLQNMALKKLPSFLVSVLQCSQPICTALMSMLLLQESLTPLGIIGACILIACIIAESKVSSSKAAEA